MRVPPGRDITVSVGTTERLTMKLEIEAALIAQLIEALKDPNFASGVVVVGMTGLIGWVATTYIKARKG